ncbi:MAG: AtpZ/AtpI family protein [Nitrospira sp.]|nr:AtpZ/AtpI family protein [Nitrospira sp.]MDD9858882.1 AtpZ/AtpI family protein [Nitrospira sp.]
MPSSPDPLYAGLGQALRVGTTLLASLIVGGGLGWGADAYLFSTAPWGVAVGLVLGLIAGVRSTYRSVQHWE